MASYAAASEYLNSSASTVPLPRPSGNTAGHLLTANIICSGSRTVTTLAGWNLIQSTTNTGSQIRISSYYRIADGTEGTTFTFTLSGVSRVVSNCSRFSPAAGKLFTQSSIVGATSGNGNANNLSINPGSVVSGDVAWALAGVYDLSNQDPGTYTLSGSGWTTTQESTDGLGAGDSVFWGYWARRTATGSVACGFAWGDGVDYSHGQAYLVRDYVPTSQTLFFGNNF